MKHENIKSWPGPKEVSWAWLPNYNIVTAKKSSMEGEEKLRRGMERERREREGEREGRRGRGKREREGEREGEREEMEGGRDGERPKRWKAREER